MCEQAPVAASQLSAVHGSPSSQFFHVRVHELYEHESSVQILLSSQLVPQLPQLFGSLLVSTHAPPQHVENQHAFPQKAQLSLVPSWVSHPSDGHHNG
jgi:hypothetical protein